MTTIIPASPRAGHPCPVLEAAALRQRKGPHVHSSCVSFSSLRPLIHLHARVARRPLIMSTYLSASEKLTHLGNCANGSQHTSALLRLRCQRIASFPGQERIHLCFKDAAGSFHSPLFPGVTMLHNVCHGTHGVHLGTAVRRAAYLPFRSSLGEEIRRRILMGAHSRIEPTRTFLFHCNFAPIANLTRHTHSLGFRLSVDLVVTHVFVFHQARPHRHRCSHILPKAEFLPIFCFLLAKIDGS